jgi:hypothetical protein
MNFPLWQNSDSFKTLLGSAACSSGLTGQFFSKPAFLATSSVSRKEGILTMVRADRD